MDRTTCDALKLKGGEKQGRNVLVGGKLLSLIPFEGGYVSHRVVEVKGFVGSAINFRTACI